MPGERNFKVRKDDRRSGNGAKKGAGFSSGQPPYVPTDENRVLVVKLIGMGLTHRDVSDVLGIHHTTFEKHFKDEIATGAAKVKAETAQRAYDLMMQDKDLGAASRMTTIMGKVHLGWREILQPRDAPGETGPITVKIIGGLPES